MSMWLASTASTWDWYQDTVTVTTASDAATYSLPYRYVPVYSPVAMPLASAPASPPVGFNRYVNASDLLEEFIRWTGRLHVQAGEVLGLPIDLFIKWLILRACEDDGVAPNVSLRHTRRCPSCGRFVRRGAPVVFDRLACAERYFTRGSALQLAAA